MIRAFRRKVKQGLFTTHALVLEEMENQFPFGKKLINTQTE